MFRFSIFLFMVLFFSAGVLEAKTMYVVSDAAKLHSSSNLKSPSTLLNRGLAVDALSNEGLFVKVKTDSAVGFVSRMYLSPFPPTKKMELGSVKKTDHVKVRARASTYSQTASARGLAKSESDVRTRGRSGEFDFLGVEWMESQHPTEEEVREFMASGGLGSG